MVTDKIFHGRQGEVNCTEVSRDENGRMFDPTPS